MKFAFCNFFLIIMCFFYSCNEDPPITSPDCHSQSGDSCFLTEIEDPYGLGVYTEYDSIMYYKPCFNPNDNNEFVYIEVNKYLHTEKLIVYNISTLNKFILDEGVDFSPKWTKSGWIIYSKGSEIWKIKSDGDLKISLFTIFDNYEPEINPEGSKIVFRQDDDYYTTIISDLAGNILDSISDAYFGAGSWSFNGLKISTKLSNGTGSFGYYDTTFTIFTPIIVNDSLDPDIFIYDTEWMPDSESILWFSNRVYNVTNITTGVTNVFADYCPKKYNMSPNFSGDGIKIIWEKTEHEVLNDCDGYHVKTSIVITDINGDNELLILD